MRKLTIKEIKDCAREAVMGRAYLHSVQDTLKTRANAFLTICRNGEYVLTIMPSGKRRYHIFIWENGEWI